MVATASPRRQAPATLSTRYDTDMPASPYRVPVTSDVPFRAQVRPRMLAGLVRRALAMEQSPPTTVTVIVTGDATVRRLNRRFRGEDRPTDVLSFLLDGGGFVPPQGRGQLGEIVVSFPTARRQARAAGHSVDNEMAHLVVHGALHLLGYDHQRSSEELVMRTKEEALLKRKVHSAGK